MTTQDVLLYLSCTGAIWIILIVFAIVNRCKALEPDLVKLLKLIGAFSFVPIGNAVLLIVLVCVSLICLCGFVVELLFKEAKE